MEQLNLITGQTKEEMAIDFLREHEPEEGYFLGFSGGKDSVVLYDLALKSGINFKAFYLATGIDAPEVVKFIKSEYPEVRFLRPEHNLFWWMKYKGIAPTKFKRWC